MKKELIKFEVMLQEQFDAVKAELISDDNYDMRQSIYCAFLEDAERGANMIIRFAREKGLKIDASSEDVIQAMNKENNMDDIDIEMTPEMLASVSAAGGKADMQSELGRVTSSIASVKANTPNKPAKVTYTQRERDEWHARLDVITARWDAGLETDYSQY